MQLNSFSDLEIQLKEAKVLIKNERLDDAITKLQAIVTNRKTDAESLYYLAVCQRKKQLIATAKSTLEILLEHHPHYARGYQELGYNYQLLGMEDLAQASFEKAIKFNSALLSSWKALEKSYRQQGQLIKAREAKQQVQWLSQLPPVLVTVSSLINENKLFMAEKICRQFLQQQPHHIEAMRLLAKIAGLLHILDDAEFLLESCLEFQPNYQRARFDYVGILHRRQKFDKALAQAQQLHSESPTNINFELILATENQAVGDFQRAIEIYDRVLSKNVAMHTTHAAKAHALKTIGQTDKSIESYRLAYSCKKDFGDAFWSLANLKTYRFTDSEIDWMIEQQASADIQLDDKVHLCFALGKALEDVEKYSESFDYYDRGNQLKCRQSRYDPKRIQRELDTQRQLFKNDFFQERRGQGFMSAEPIFIVGLPRAGSTLIEQILASHSQVDGTMELANIIGLAHRLNGRQVIQDEPRYPSILQNLTSEQCFKFGEAFIEDTQYHRRGGLYFIDKMPNNFRHIALIQLILPKAKIIDARRHPMACCFSGYKQLFAEGQEFTYGLDNIGLYYKGYIDIMNHWDRELPAKVLRVQHEDVVTDLDTQVRRILDYCELPFEQQCIDFHKTERAIRTPSSEQVRQPIYQSGLQQWRNYEPFLNPLKQALGSALINYQ